MKREVRRKKEFGVKSLRGINENRRMRKDNQMWNNVCFKDTRELHVLMTVI